MAPRAALGVTRAYTSGVDDFTNVEALAAIVQITGGNFQVIHRLLMQIECILEINHLQTVTREVVEKARERLVLG